MTSEGLASAHDICAGSHAVSSPVPISIPEVTLMEEEEEEEEEEGKEKEEGVEEAGMGGSSSTHRTRLPATRVDAGDLSLWSLLRKNIGNY